jgi:hypothetical protein
MFDLFFHFVIVVRRFVVPSPFQILRDGHRASFDYGVTNKSNTSAPSSLPPPARPPCGPGEGLHGRVMILDAVQVCAGSTPVGLTVTFNRYPLRSALWLRGAGLVNALPWGMRLREMLCAHHSAPRITPTTAPLHSRFDTPTTAPLPSRFDTPTTAPLSSRFDMARPSTL